MKSIVVTTRRLDPIDLSAAFESVRKTNELAFYRFDADSEEILAIGQAFTAKVGPESSLSQAFDALSATVDHRETAPLRFFGWTAFDPDFEPDNENPWQAFPRRTLFVPRVLLRRRGNKTEATLSAAPGDLAAMRLLEHLLEQENTPINDRPASQPDPTISQPTWLDGPSFRAGVTRMSEENMVDKIVLARRARVDASADFDTSQILARLAGDYPRCTRFALSPAHTPAAFVGATPELLASIQDKEISTMALAGTARTVTGGTRQAAEAALLTSEKDLEEHQYVIDQITEDLQPLTTSLTVSESPVLHRLANVTHLHTPITGALRPDVTPADVVDALHPTPAVCGVPRDEARHWIQELEPFDRGLYAGAFGDLSPDGTGRFHVALRCALIQGSTATVFTGAGITASSDVDVEWAETSRKADAMLSALRQRP